MEEKLFGEVAEESPTFREVGFSELGRFEGVVHRTAVNSEEVRENPDDDCIHVRDS